MRASPTILMTALAMALCTHTAFGQQRSITQIDTRGLLTAQGVRLYVTGAGGASIPDDILVEESSDGVEFVGRPLRAVTENANADDGISFFLLLDNSGSMWTDMAGDESADQSALRIGQAKSAIETFLRDLGDRDKVGLAVFNTRYWSPARPAANPVAVAMALEEIRKPSKEDAFTELYLSIDRALADFAELPGRRVLIVLSDGENYPYFARTGKPNPDFGDAVASPSAVVERATADGITCYAVRFGDDKDPSLGTVALESGGSVFDARNERELYGIYASIRRDVLREVAVDYGAGMQPGDKRLVRVSVDRGASWSAVRHYYAGNVFGVTRQQPSALYLLMLLVPAILWLLLWLFKLERQTDRAGIRLMYGPSGGRTTMFTLDGPQTVIGGGADADITIGGNPSLKANHATILFDEIRNEYTIAASSDLTVNNRPVSKKRLEPGDVINMAGTVVVFDDAPKPGPKKTKG